MPEVKSNRAWRLECESLRARLAEADREATVLVFAMADQCGAPDNWRPLPGVAGKITQISNMAAGLRSRLAEYERDFVASCSLHAHAGLEARLAEADALLREALAHLDNLGNKPDLKRRIDAFLAKEKP